MPEPAREQILIVNREANFRRVLAAQLGKDELDVHTVSDGQAAFAFLEEHHVDVLITGLRLGAWDGLELLRAALGHDPNLPVIILSAYGSVDTAVEALKIGAFDYVTAPFDEDELRLVVQKALRTRALAREAAVRRGTRHEVEDSLGSADLVWRYQLPYPLASLYMLSRCDHRASARLSHIFQLAEGSVRFLAYCGMADALRHLPTAKEARKWFKALEATGTGKLLALLEWTAAAPVEGGRFIPEAADLKGGAWGQAVDAIKNRRNELKSVLGQLTDSEAKPHIDELAPHLTTLLDGLRFLSKYHLGWAVGLRVKTGRFESFWYPLRGAEDRAEPLKLVSEHAVPSSVPLLISPDGKEALVLAPYMVLARADSGGREQLVWLEKWMLQDEAGYNPQRPFRYRHSATGLCLERALVSADSPEGPGLALADYLDRRAEWDTRRQVGLSSESLALLSASLGGHGARGEVIDGRYEVVGVLGRGGTGEVLHVVDRTSFDRREGALKRLDRRLLGDPSWLRRFNREGRLLSKLSIPGLVRIYWAGFLSDDVPAILMELIEGEDVRRRLERTGPFPVRQAIRMTVELLETVGALHDEEIIHRDIKPSNLLIDRQGRVTLIDLGIAAHLEGTRLTRTMEVVGTEGFMAPEQRAGLVSEASDIFSIGRVLFALVVGRATHDPRETLAGTVDSEVPTDLDAIYARATELRPEDRFASVAEFSEALQNVLRSSTRSPSRPAPSSPTKRRHRPPTGKASARPKTPRKKAKARSKKPVHQASKRPSRRLSTKPFEDCDREARAKLIYAALLHEGWLPRENAVRVVGRYLASRAQLGSARVNQKSKRMIDGALAEACRSHPGLQRHHGKVRAALREPTWFRKADWEEYVMWAIREWYRRHRRSPPLDDIMESASREVERCNGLGRAHAETVKKSLRRAFARMKDVYRVDDEGLIRHVS